MASLQSRNAYSKTKYYVGEVEYFGVYCGDLDRCYLIPVKDAPTAVCSLRVNPTKNGHTQKIRWAKDYEI